MGVTAEPQLLDCVTSDHPGIRGPDALAFGIEHDRYLVGLQIAVPSGTSVRPGNWRPPIMAEALGEGRCHSPTDVPGGVPRNHVLVRNAEPVRDRERLLSVLCVLKLQSGTKPNRDRVVRNPSIGQLAPFEVSTDDRSPDALLDRELFRLRALPAEAFLVKSELLRPLWRAVPTGVPFVRLEDDDVARVDVAVCIGPGHSTIAAGHDDRRPWQGDARDVRTGHTWAARHNKTRSVPDVRDAKGEMEIVGDDCRTALGEAATHCEAVTAREWSFDLTQTCAGRIRRPLRSATGHVRRGEA